MFASKKDIKTTSGCEDFDGDFKIFKMSKNLHEMFASEDISTAGGGDEDVAPVNAILDGGHLRGFKVLNLLELTGKSSGLLLL